jgi:hypothetical protein
MKPSREDCGHRGLRHARVGPDVRLAEACGGAALSRREGPSGRRAAAEPGASSGLSVPGSDAGVTRDVPLRPQVTGLSRGLPPSPGGGAA